MTTGRCQPSTAPKRHRIWPRFLLKWALFQCSIPSLSMTIRTCGNFVKLHSPRCCGHCGRPTNGWSSLALLSRLHTALLNLRPPHFQRCDVGEKLIGIGDCDSTHQRLVMCIVRAFRHACIDLGIVVVIDHDASEPLRFHALTESEDHFTQQDFFDSTLPRHA